MAFTEAALRDMLGEFGRKMLYEQANLASPLIDFMSGNGKKKSKYKLFEILDEPTKLGSVNIKNGGLASNSGVKDGANRATPEQLDWAHGYYGVKIQQGNLSFPEGVTRVGSGSEGVDIVEQSLRTTGMDLARTLDRQLTKHELCSPTATALINATSIAVDDISGLRVGQRVDLYASNGTTFHGTMLISAIVPTSSLGGTLTIPSGTDDAGAATVGVPIAILTNMRLFLQAANLSSGGGATAPPSRAFPVNLTDVCTAATQLYSGFASAATQPAGYKDSGTTALVPSVIARGQTMVRVQSGCKANYILCHPINAERLMISTSASVRFVEASKMDLYGAETAVGGSIIVEDPNCGLKDVWVGDFSPENIQLHQFWGFGPKGAEGGKNGKWGRGALQNSQTTVGDVMFITGAHELRVQNRQAFAHFSAIAS